MRNLLVALAGVAGCLVPSPAVSADVAGHHATSVQAAAARTSAHGHWLTDGQGRALVVTGVNMVAKLAPYAPDADGFGADDARFLASHGFTAVRLGLLWEGVEPTPGHYDDGYLRRVERTARILHRHGIHVLLDLHQDLYSEAYAGEGAPSWAVDDHGLPNESQAGFPGNYAADPATSAAFDSLWDNAAGPGGVGLADRYAAMAAHVAAAFKSTPGILGLDLFNEPWPGSTWATCVPPLGCPAADARLQAFDERAIAAIRKVDRRTTLFYEPSVFIDAGAPTYVDPGGRNLALSFHDYCATASGAPTDRVVQAACGEAGDMTWGQVAAHLKATAEPGLLTEFGATTDTATITGMVDRADQAMDGWLYWAYCGCGDPTTTGPGTEQALVLDPRKPPTGANVDHAKLRALESPHPMAVAGTPTAYRFARDTDVFTASWTTAKPAGGEFGEGARTTVWLPRAVYPHGYRVRVRGARVVSKPGARTLVLAQRAGAGTVRLRVAPAR